MVKFVYETDPDAVVLKSFVFKVIFILCTQLCKCCSSFCSVSRHVLNPAKISKTPHVPKRIVCVEAEQQCSEEFGRSLPATGHESCCAVCKCVEENL